MENDVKPGKVNPLVRLRIEVIGEDGDACRKLLRDLCDMIDSDLDGAPCYSVSKIIGSASCDVDTLPNRVFSGLFSTYHPYGMETFSTYHHIKGVNMENRPFYFPHITISPDIFHLTPY